MDRQMTALPQLTDDQRTTLQVALMLLETFRVVEAQDVARLMQLPPRRTHVIAQQLRAIARRGLLVSTTTGFTVERPAPVPLIAEPVGSFIRPISKARLMAGRA